MCKEQEAEPLMDKINRYISCGVSPLLILALVLLVLRRKTGGS